MNANESKPTNNVQFIFESVLLELFNKIYHIKQKQKKIFKQNNIMTN